MSREKKSFLGRNKRYLFVALCVYALLTLLLILFSIDADDIAFVYQVF